jgi:N utilization substance protein B
MGNRRQARELAMQALFFMDMRQNTTQGMLDFYCQSFTPSKRVLPFFLDLVKGVMRAGPQIDSIVERFSNNWKISRMSGVDRNVIRIAVYELLYCQDIPSKVTINEAIDIGKKFGTEESGAFINGILDSIRLALAKEDIKTRDVKQKNGVNS